MSEFNQFSQVNGEKRKLGRLGMFFVGLFGGGLAGGSITAYFVKKRCEAKQQEAVEKAQEEAIRESSKQAQAWIDQHFVVPEPAKADIKEKIDKLFDDKGSKKCVSVETSAEKGSEKVEFVKKDEVYHVDLGSDSIPDSSVLENWDTNIDDEEATDEALERTEQHEKYLDMLDKYHNSPELLPRKISSEEFLNSHFLEKVYVTWYSDGIFGVDQENDAAIDDPYTAFGVTNGADLFRNPDRDDPDVVHIRNEKLSIDYEITRSNTPYSKIKSGEAYYHEPN